MKKFTNTLKINNFIFSSNVFLVILQFNTDNSTNVIFLQKNNILYINTIYSKNKFDKIKYNYEKI
jgi:hypothetical protein